MSAVDRRRAERTKGRAIARCDLCEVTRLCLRVELDRHGFYLCRGCCYFLEENAPGDTEEELPPSPGDAG